MKENDHFSLYGRILSLSIGKQLKSLDIALTRIVLDPTPLDNIGFSAILEFPYAAGMLGADKRLQAFNIKLVNMITGDSADRNVLSKPYEHWADCLQRHYEFSADVGETSYSGKGADTGPNKLIVYLSAKEIANLLEEAFEGARLTPIEASTLVLVIKGIELRDIAKMDGVSYETRRTQLKQIRQKLGQSNRTDLVHSVSTRINSKLFSILFDNYRWTHVLQPDRIDWQVMTRHYGPSVRIQQHAYPECPQFTSFDIGPIAGKPVLIFAHAAHPYYPIPSGLEYSYKMNIRTIVLARPGYCGTSDIPISTELERRAYYTSVDKFLGDLGISSLSILSILTGAVWAAEFLRATSLDVEKAIFANPYMSLPRVTDTGATKRMAMRLRDIASRSPHNLRILVRLLSSLLHSPEAYIAMMRRLFRHSPVDLALIDSSENEPFALEWIPRSSRHNIEGIANDLMVAQNPWLENIRDISVPITLLMGETNHGPQHDLAEQIAASIQNGSVEFLPDADYLYPYLQPERVMAYFNEPEADEPVEPVA